MKKYLIMLLMLIICLTGCEKGKEKMDNKVKQDLEIIVQNDDKTVKEGILEGYRFAESENETDRVKIEMANGNIILAVLSNGDTPITIANFKKLVSEKFYDGIIFHRVINEFMIQGGDPTGTGYYGSNDKIKGEFSENGVKNTLSHDRGVLSMARSNDMNSASSQFFIVHSDKYKSSLDGKYASFGKVFAGMDTVDFIAKVETDENDKPLQEQKIKTIRFITIIKD